MSSEDAVRALLDERLGERGLGRADARAAGAWTKDNWPGLGPVMVLPFVTENGGEVRRLLPLSKSKDAGGGWRWEKGAAARGAVLPLVAMEVEGDAVAAVERRQGALDVLAGASIVIVCEGESDGLSAWRHLRRFGPELAVLVLPGATTVGSLANFVPNNARVVLAMDSDQAGDRCAEQAHSVLIAAGVDDGLVSRFRPSVPGVDAPDLRDLVEHLEGESEDVAAGLRTLLLGPGEVPVEVAPVVSEAPESLAGLLMDVGGFVRRMVVVTEDQAAAIALWVAHTHVIEAAEATPYLAITSAEKRSGKSKLLELLALLARKAILTANISTAALFRVIDTQTPAVFVDEADAIFARRNGAMREAAEELRGLLNAGHRRGAVVYRMVGQGAAMVPREFKVFGAKALAAIGKLPDTIADRSIVIRMKRKGRGEHVERFRRREVEPQAAAVRGLLAAWAEGAVDVLTSARPALPDELDDRAADGWEPLLAIADAAGGEWPAAARRAALALSAGRDGQDGEASIGVRLLGDIRAVFDEAAADRLSTSDLLKSLVAVEESPWADLRGKPLTPRRLSDILHRYEVRSRSIRLDDNSTPKGYLREQFEDPWARYLPHDVPPTRHNATTRMGKGITRDLESATGEDLWRIENGRDPASVNGCGGVADSSGEYGVQGAGEGPSANGGSPAAEGSGDDDVVTSWRDDLPDAGASL